MTLVPLGDGWQPLIRKALDALLREKLHADDAAGLRLAEDRVEQAIPLLGSYLDELVRWNQRTDLTAARSAEQLVDLTLADAAILAGLAAQGHWVDVGSGAGAPGIPLALLTGAELTLVEPKAKRVAFLRSIVGTLKLPRLRVERARCEQLPPGVWNEAVSRATLAADEWLKEGARLAKHSVWVLLAKGAPPSLNRWTVLRDIRYHWPLTGAERRALCFVASDPACQGRII